MDRIHWITTIQIALDFYTDQKYTFLKYFPLSAVSNLSQVN